MGSRFDRPARQQHHSRTAAQHEAGVVPEEYWEYKPGQRVGTVDGPGKVKGVEDGPFPGSEHYIVELDGGLGGGQYTASQLSPGGAATASLEQTAAADYPELAQILTERPDPARIHTTASADGEFYDPACAYPHEGPCEASAAQHTASLYRMAMPAKSGRPTRGEFTYDMSSGGYGGSRKVLNGYIDGKHAGTIAHSSYVQDWEGNGYTHEPHEAEAVKVHMLHTEPHARGTGVASAMMDALYHHYPNAWVNHGFRTDDGSKWWNGYDEPDPSRNVHNVAPHDNHPRLDHHWTSHFDTEDVVSDMDSLAHTNAEHGHEGNAHRQWDHTEYGGHHAEEKCWDCDSDREHRCSDCGGYYPHEQGDFHKDCEENPANKVKCNNCDDDGEHACKHCGDATVAHDDIEEHERDCEENPENKAPDESNPTKSGLHNSVTVPLTREEHDFVHNTSVPTDKRAHVLLNRIGRGAMPDQHWVGSPQQAHDEESATQNEGNHNRIHGRGLNTVVTLHSHPLNEHESGESAGLEHYSQESDRAHFDGNPVSFRLKGLSWGQGSQAEHHHEFQGDGERVSTPPSDYMRDRPRQMPSQMRQQLQPFHREPGHQAPAAPVHQDQMKLFTSLITTAALDADFRFHVTAAWRDVVAKAKRIRSEGGVRVTLATDGIIYAEVKGDHHVYETGLQRLPGRTAVASWNCGCKWAAYHWGADDDFSRFAGRMCSHALALNYEAQSRGMFGRDVHVDEERPEWTPRHVVVRHDIDSGTNRLQLSSALQHTGPVPADAPLRRIVSALAAAGNDRAEISLALHAAGIRVQASDWDDFHEDENGRRYTLDEDGEPSYACHNKYCDEGGEHGGDGETAQHHDDVYTDWDTVHPHLGPHLHRGMAVDLPDHVHSVVHDDSRSTADRAHALAEHLRDEGLGMHWTPDHDQARHYTGVSDSNHHDTHVIVHAHTPGKDAIETDPDTLAARHVIAMGDHDDQEVPLREGAQLSLKGVSWRHRTDDKWTRHDFPEGLSHMASVAAPFGEPSGTSYVLPKAPGATQKRRPWENPASAGPLAGADPVGWNRHLPLESYASLDDSALFEPGGAEAQLNDEPEGALPSTDGVQIPSEDEALTPSMAKRALKDFSFAEQQELINEGENVRAANLDRLQISGTHYEDLEQVLAAKEDDTTWLS